MTRPYVTALGPRDEAWLDAAIDHPRVALDITPWWMEHETDGRFLLNRALVLMWLQVRWRPPAVEGEADLLDEVHRLLSRAFPSRSVARVSVAWLGAGLCLPGRRDRQ